jgi:uncharacterized protein (TIRG00374 family)
MRLAAWLRRPIVWLPISIGLVALLVWRAKPWDAANDIDAVDPVPLVAAVLLCAVVVGLWAVRSADLLAAAGRPVPIRSLIPMTAFANAINNLTPGSAGEVVRMYLLRMHHEVDYATSGGVIFIERIGAIGYLTTGSILAWLTWLGVVPGWLAVIVLIALIVGPGAVYRAGLRPLVVIRILPIGSVVGLERQQRMNAWLSRVDDTVARLLGRPRHLLAFVAITYGIFAAYTAQLLLVGRAVGVALDPLAAFGALGIATTVGVLSLLPFGLGTTDLTLAGFLGLAGVSPPAALAMTLGYRLVSTLPLGIAGVVSYAWLSARLPGTNVAEATRSVRSAVGDAPVDPAYEP